MPTGKGLVAPQNTFLESIIKNCVGKNDCFLLANVRIVDYPIVYCSEGFTRLTGYTQTEVLQRSASCKFMYGSSTAEDTKQKLLEAVTTSTRQSFVMSFNRKNNLGGPLFMLTNTAPIRNEEDVVILLLIYFRDVTNSKTTTSVFDAEKTIKLTDESEEEERREKSRFHSFASSIKKYFGSAKTNKVTPTASFNNDAIPQYRQEPPKTLPQILLHYSHFRNVWEWVILVFTIATAMIAPYAAAFNLGAPADDTTLMILDDLMDIVFLLDIILNLHTTFVDVSGQSSAHVIKLIRLFRLVRVGRTLDRYMEYGQAVLVLLLMAFLLISHWFACIWYAAGRYETLFKLNFDSWVYKLSNDISQGYSIVYETNTTKLTVDIPKDANVWNLLINNQTVKSLNKENLSLIKGPSNFSSYISALYYVLTCLTSVGFGNIAANTVLEKVITSFIMIFGALLYASIFGNVTTLFQQLYMATGKYHDMLKSIQDFMKFNTVPKVLKERVLDYVVSTWTVLNYCPNDMRADICVHLNRMVFKQNPAFRLASESCLRAMAVHFSMMHSAPGDVICHQGESLNSVCFVVSGSLEVVQDEEIIALLGCSFYS
ncbi:hypothetical protein HELRODRAFT_162328 [Helobdella robusta]|uniref:Cyclic nucleotide-binding domain-containing protein n=1 Tax=Helobdella robusta TaxID=6412 RepID=T1ESI5_HELRO|nr:hypothetical protein HELRODRAFT_162328 [Helobdella robusta]ESN98867.1 hypothetical protein HELRODRAFT_162328 [Helobdella robusta]